MGGGGLERDSDVVPVFPFLVDDAGGFHDFGGSFYLVAFEAHAGLLLGLRGGGRRAARCGGCGPGPGAQLLLIEASPPGGSVEIYFHHDD